MQPHMHLRRPRTTMVIALPAPRAKADTDASGPTPHAARPTSSSKFRKVAWLGALLALLGTGAFFRQQSAAQSMDENPPAHASIRQVNVTTPQHASTGEIILPATIQAYQATDLFARASGFLKAWHV